MSFSNIINRIASILYPERCIFCDRTIFEPGNIKICSLCVPNFKTIEEPACKMCGVGLTEQRDTCPSCENERFAFVRGSALMEYSEFTKPAVLGFKFNGRREYSKTIISLMAKDIMKKNFVSDINIIIPVPLHKTKLIQRGYNQTEILAAGLGKRLGIPVNTVSLKRIKKTVQQAGLNKEERQGNIMDSMKVVSPSMIAGKDILLIDDIFTTGSTFNECAGELIKNGARSVIIYSVCVVHN